MLRNRVKRAVKNSIKNLEQNGKLKQVPALSIRIQKPTRKEQGDYSVSVAMQIASALNRKPKTIAKIIQTELLSDEKLLKIFSDIKVASPGFLNFYIKNEYLKKLLWKILNTDDFGKINTAKTRKLNIEFGSVNPTGELHVGHARTFFYGDVLSNILTFAGHRVTREYYINNARQSAQIKEIGKTVLGNGTSYKSPYLDKKIRKFATSLKRYKNFGTAGYFISGKIQKDIKEVLTKKARVDFDIWFREEDLYKNGEVDEVMKGLKKKDLIYEKEGALWLKTSKFGDKQDQVLVRSSGENTYFITDIAYHKNKAKRGFDKFIDIWGADHHGHFRRMQAALKILGIKNVDILIAQFVRLKGGAKLSKRKGNIVTIEDLINEVGLDAARFFYLTKSLDSQMEFDIKLAKKQSQKNPVYYIQYTHARICSIVRKATKNNNQKINEITANGGIPHDAVVKKKDLDALKEAGEFDLIRKLVIFPEIIEDISRDYQVHHLTTYVYELSQEFNQFYRDFRVIGKDPSAGSGQVKSINHGRLILAVATGIVIKQCLDLLGINAPKSM